MPRSLPFYFLLALAGCDSLECGFGTVERDDMCVQAVPSVECGEGTLQSGNTCVATCGDGTVVSEDGLSCVAECTDGSVLDAAGTACVAECGDGAILNSAGTACVADLADLCADGTFVSSSDTCVDWAGLLLDEAVDVYDSADSATVVDDPFLFDLTVSCTTDAFGAEVCTVDSGPRIGNGPTPIALPAEGETAVLRGTIELIGDLSGDGYEDVDWDVFAVEASAGDRLRLTPSSTGDGQPWFEIVRYDGVPSGSDLSDTSLLPDLRSFIEAGAWARAARQWGAPAFARDVLIDTDGLYLIRVTDRDTAPQQFQITDLDNDGVDDVQFLQSAVPTGGPEHDYLIALENLGPVDPTSLPSLELGSDSAIVVTGGRESYGQVHDETYLVTTADDSFGFLAVEIRDYGNQPEGVISAIPADFSAPPSSMGLGPGTDYLPVLPGGAVVSHDFFNWVGAANGGYDIQLTDPLMLEGGLPVTHEFTSPGAVTPLLLEAKAGDLVEIGFDSFGSQLDPAIILSSWDAELSQWVVDACGTSINLPGAGVDSTACTTADDLFPSVARFYTEDTWVRITVQDVAADSAASDLSFTIRADVSQPQVLEADGATVTSASGATEALAAGDVGWVILDLTVTDLNSNELTLDLAAGDATMGFEFERWEQTDIQSTIVSSEIVDPGQQASSKQYPQEDTIYLLRVAHTEGATSDVGVDLTFGPPAIPDIEAELDVGVGIDLSGQGDDLYHESYLNLGDACNVDSLMVPIDIEHEYRGDLRVTLVAPSGVAVVLQEASGDPTENLVGTYPSSLIPTDSLEAFEGTSTAGTWTMIVEDTYPAVDGGRWNNWGLRIFCQ